MATLSLPEIQGQEVQSSLSWAVAGLHLCPRPGSVGVEGLLGAALHVQALMAEEVVVL